jgi:hypothetical protein
MRRAAALGADLHHASVFAGGGQHRLALQHIHARRFLAVNVRPGFARFDHGQGVPVIGRGDQDDIQILLLEHGAIVRVRPRLPFGELARGHQVRGVAQHGFVHVAQRDDFNGCHLDQAEEINLAIPAATDEADALLGVAKINGVAGEGGQCECDGGAVKKLAAIHELLLVLSGGQHKSFFSVLHSLPRLGIGRGKTTWFADCAGNTNIRPPHQ